MIALFPGLIACKIASLSCVLCTSTRYNPSETFPGILVHVCIMKTDENVSTFTGQEGGKSFGPDNGGIKFSLMGK